MRYMTLTVSLIATEMIEIRKVDKNCRFNPHSKQNKKIENYSTLFQIHITQEQKWKCASNNAHLSFSLYS